MTTLEILKGARALLSDPARWTKGSFALNKDGQECSPKAMQAQCFCSIGAVQAFGETFADRMHAYALLDGRSWIASWNDAPERTHAEVLQHFDEAVARLEAAPCP